MSSNNNFWKERRIIVTGGASFIGSHLVDKLVSLGGKITVVDDLSTGKMENLSESINKIKFVKMDLEYCTKSDIDKVFQDTDIVFHLAADHGGRGYITTHPADVCSSFAVDHHVYEACSDTNVQRVIFSSSACVYPTELQKDVGSDYKLKETDSDIKNLDGYMSADIEYGWAKLMSEMQMNSFKKQYGLHGCPVRFVTAYGPRENETHAIIALIYKAVEKMDPYEIWGNGQQERDFTYVEDIVDGTMLAAEKITDMTPINIGTGKRYKMVEVADLIFKILDWRPKDLKFDATKPTGAVSRALDNTRAKEFMGWTPKYTLEEGLRKTIQWYVKTHRMEGRVDQNILLENNPTK